MASKIAPKLARALNSWKAEDRLRSLTLPIKGKIDFASNDYLGLGAQKLNTSSEQAGSSGSRLLTGHHAIHEQLEQWAAQFYGSEAALLFSSGYMANLGVLSCLPQRGDTVLYDEACHASLKDGIRLSMAKKVAWKHQDLEDLRSKLDKASGEIYVVTEALFSMDGDWAPLQDLVDLTEEKGAWLILDEAHSTGIRGQGGKGLTMDLGLQERVWMRIHTFGKAAGMSGALVACSQDCREYLINRSRPFIYTTAPGPLFTEILLRRLQEMAKAESLREQLWERAALFKEEGKNAGFTTDVTASSPIIPLIIPGVREVRRAARYLNEAGFDVRPVIAPTVREGSERLRIVIHAQNSEEEIKAFWQAFRSLPKA